jgi:hypothetical protein
MGNTLTAPSFVSTQQDLPTLLLDIPQYLHHAVLGGQFTLNDLSFRSALYDESCIRNRAYAD